MNDLNFLPYGLIVVWWITLLYREPREWPLVSGVSVGFAVLAWLIGAAFSWLIGPTAGWISGAVLVVLLVLLLESFRWLLDTPYAGPGE